MHIKLKLKKWAFCDYIFWYKFLWIFCIKVFVKMKLIYFLRLYLQFYDGFHLSYSVHTSCLLPLILFGIKQKWNEVLPHIQEVKISLNDITHCSFWQFFCFRSGETKEGKAWKMKTPAIWLRSQEHLNEIKFFHTFKKARQVWIE